MFEPVNNIDFQESYGTFSTIFFYKSYDKNMSDIAAWKSTLNG